MNRNWGSRIGAVVMLAVVTLGSNSWAQSPGPKTHATKGEWEEALKQLREAHRILLAADHDYSGHRAKAAEEVHKAIEELAGRHHDTPEHPGTEPAETATSNKPPKKSEGHPHEPQGESDTQLRQAQSILEAVKGELNSRHPKAAEKVQAAIAEITTALSLK